MYHIRSHNKPSAAVYYRARLTRFLESGKIKDASHSTKPTHDQSTHAYLTIHKH